MVGAESVLHFVRCGVPVNKHQQYCLEKIVPLQKVIKLKCSSLVCYEMLCDVHVLHIIKNIACVADIQ